MKPRRIAALCKKELKKTVREPAILFMIFLFPLVFVLTFGAAFGGVGSSQTSYSIGVVNLDDDNIGNATQSFLQALGDTQILDMRLYQSNETAQADLSQGKIQAVMIIPENFSESLASLEAFPHEPEKWVNVSISLYLDKGSLIATQAIPPIIENVLSSLVNIESPQSPLQLKIASLVETETISAFEFMAPGMFTFASIFLIMMVAQSFTQDRENGMMKRLRTTPLTSTEFMTSQVISYMLIALLQAVIVFLAIYIIGFQPAVSVFAYIFAFLIVLVFSISNVGFGLITATLAKSSGAATGISFLFVLPQLFLGTFVGSSLSPSAQIASRCVPSYYVTDALTSIFLRKADIFSSGVMYDFLIVAASCLAILLIGILLYRQYLRM
ncbi:MAG: ABC transporter permease [Methanomassiliicoccales archaeon]